MGKWGEGLEAMVGTQGGGLGKVRGLGGSLGDEWVLRGSTHNSATRSTMPFNQNLQKTYVFDYIYIYIYKYNLSCVR